MHPRARRRSGILASATVLTLLAVPGPALAAPDPEPVPVARPDGPAARATSADVDPQDKIGPAARKAFATRSAPSFWLRFGDTADLSAAQGITSWAERGEHVHDTLVETAAAAQESAVAELEEAGVEYTSYWATNAILVEGGSLGLATELAADAEVLEIRPTAHYEEPRPVGAQDAGAQESDTQEVGTQELDAQEATAAAAAAGTPTWGISAINADDLWDAGYTGEGIVVANIDTGVDGVHPALAAQYRGRESGDAYNYFSADGGTRPHDPDGHGTHTMGTMVGTTVRDGGADRAVGVAPDAEWIAAGVGGGELSDADLISSGQWILAPFDQDAADPVPEPGLRPHVVNNSWGADFSTDPFMENIVRAWEAAGIFATFSGGNAGEQGCRSAGSPASRTVNYAVGAFTQSGRIAAFSARGPGQSGTVKPDVAAPGANVLSTMPSGRSDHLDGTSMAAPHVAGAVALLWSAVPELVGDVQTTRALIDGSATDVDDTSCGGTADDNNVWGEGKLDVLAAYELARERAFDVTTVPTISGADHRVGTPLTATVDAWSPAATLSYQWRRDTDPDDDRGGAMISGATARTYTPRGADAGATLSVTVVGSADGRTTTSTTSTATRTIAVGDLRSAAPTVGGTVRVGSTLRALSGTWTSGTRFTYQWKANDVAISGATSFTFRPRPSDRGKKLTVTVTGTRKGYVAASRTSPAKTVGYGVYAQGRPRLIGSPVPGATVRVSAPPSQPAAATTTYQWRVDDWPLKGATKSSYTIPSTWKGRVISVSVTRKGSGYTTKTVTSTQRKIGARFTAIATPRITGTTRVGSTVRVVPGTWRPAANRTYQWYSDGVPISGATGTTYRITGKHLGKKLTVVVTGRKAGYATADKSSGTVPVYRPATIIPADGWYFVGPDSVPAATYVAQAGSKQCVWERLNGADQVLGGDYGTGQRVATVRSGDGSFRSQDCGTWVKHYPGMMTPRVNTPKNGVYVLGDQLERGTYMTPGPAQQDRGCYYGFLREFAGTADGSHLVGSGWVDEATTITMPASAKGFETGGCHWYRVG